MTILPEIVAIVGRPDCGKTTLIEKLLPELRRRGYRVGTIKHHVHRFEMDREGKDTWRHKKAGAVTVALSSPTGLGVIMDVDHDLEAAELRDRYFSDVDLVLAEGYKSTSLPKIEIFRKAVQDTPLPGRDATWIAIVSDSPIDVDLPCFDPEDIPSLADLLTERFIKPSARPQIFLLADDRPVPLNDFAASFIAGTVRVMTSSLNGCEEAEEITIKIKMNDADGD